MGLSRTYRPHPDEPGSDDLFAWRYRRLRTAGFPPALAEDAAGDLGFDLHALLELVDRGCPPALAARIAAPLESPGGSP